jgi:hypothetical protein
MNLKSKTIILTISLLTLFSCSKPNKQKIVGEWIIETINGKELQENEKMAFIILIEDGICEQGTDGVCELGGDNTIKGTWRLSENNQNLIINNDDKTESIYTEVTVNKNELSLIHDKTPISFKRKNK